VSNFDSPDTEFKSEAASLEERLRTRFAVVEHPLVVAERSYELRHPRSADELISEEEFNRDERLPYWAEIWPSAYVLAERIAAESGEIGGRQRRLLELGCGSGLAVMTALSAGFAVTAVDYYAEALEFVRLNTALNGLPRPETRVADWRKYPSDLVDFDIVIAADVLYERDYCRLVAAAFKQSLRSGGLGLLTDPQRTKAEFLPDECRSAGLSISEPQVFGPLSVPGGDPSVKQTVNLFEIRHVARDRQFEC
jgi:predicted nicotinamide N-methyase